MTWGAVAGAAASVVGGYLSGKGQKQQTYIPRRATKDAERDRLAAMSNALYGGTRRQPGGGLAGSAEDLYTNPENFPEYAPRPFSDPNAYELAGIDQLGGFATSAFPELYGRYADTTMSGAADGGVDAYTQSFRDVLPKIQSYFGGGAPQISGGNVNLSPVELSNQQFLPSGAGAWTPNVTPTVTADANPTLQNLLSGDADVRGLNGAVSSYLAPMMEQFNQQILPSLQRADAAATGGQSSAGALKASQRTLEEIGQNANQYATGLLYDASQRGLDRAGAAAGLVTQGRQQDAGLGLQAADLGQRGLFGAGGLTLDQFSRNLGRDELMARILEGNADRNVSVGTANAGLQQSYMDQLLSGAALGVDAGVAGQKNKLGFAGLFPSLMETGMMGPQALSLAGTGLRGLLDPYAKYNADRFTYEENLPYQMSNQWTGILQGLEPRTAAPAQANQGSGGNVGAGLATMLAMFPSMGGSSTASPAPSGSTGATGYFNPQLAGIS